MPSALVQVGVAIALGLLRAGEGFAVEPPEAIEASRQRATHRFVLEVDALAPTETSTVHLHRCRAEGRIAAVTRAPSATDPAHALGPRAGERFAVDVDCWPEAEQATEPPGPVRAHYGPNVRLPRLEIWGRWVEERFVVESMEEIAPVAAAPGARAEEAAMREQIESAYRAMRDASASREEPRLREALSTRAFALAESNLARMGKRFTPEWVEAFAEDLPDLGALEHVETRQQGAAAYALYRSAVSEGDDGEPSVLFVYVKAVEERGGWKYDGLLDMERPATEDDGGAARFDPTLLPPELRL